MNKTSPAFTFQDNHPELSDFANDALLGLRANPRSIPPKYFYNEIGSQLFNQICETPEYYQTRTEYKILQHNIEEITQQMGPVELLIEPGSGNSAKVRKLLNALRPHTYLPMDISKSHLREEAYKLSQEYPWLNVHAICTDFTVSLPIPSHLDHHHKVAFFPGSSIGNFEPKAAIEFMKRINEMLGSGGGLLIGVDLKKETNLLNAAYNDKENVTAAFNLNLLTRMNKELGADFDLSAFRHNAFYNEEIGRIEMHLRSEKDQHVKFSDHSIKFAAGETIHTENSYKYSIPEFEALAGSAGFSLERSWTDKDNLFSLLYLSVQS